MKAAAIAVGALIALFFLIGVLSSNSPEGQAKAQKRASIDLCWQDQGRKSLDPGTARFVAGACERLESDFVREFGVRP